MLFRTRSVRLLQYLPMYGMNACDQWVQKSALLLTRESLDVIAGSSATLIEHASKFWTWDHASMPEVIRAVMATPADMLGSKDITDTLDADLAGLDAHEDEGEKSVADVEVRRTCMRCLER